MDKPTSKRKEREKEARREAILDAAGRVFSRKGFHEATLEEIAQEAELAKGTLYNYYKDKIDIFFSLIERGYLKFKELLPVLAQQEGTIQEFLENIFTHSMEYMIEHRYLFRVAFTAEHQLSQDSWERNMDHLLKHVDIVVQRLAEALKMFPGAPSLSDAEATVGAKLIMASMRFLFVTRVIGGTSEFLKQDTRDFARLISRALSVEQTS